MTFQPQDERKELRNAYECITLETSEYSQNIIQNRATPFTFSPIINIANDSSSVPSSSNNHLISNNEDYNDIEKILSPDSEVHDEIDKILNSDGFNDGDLLCNDSNDWITNELDRVELQKIDQSIQDRRMSIEIQPPTDIRRRYQSDGKRQIEKSRSKPMTIKLPNLNNCQLNSNQTFWIQLILITCHENPAKKVYIHADRLEYHADDLPECDHGFVRVPLTSMDIQKEIKQLARISIIKAKLDTYSFKLTPYNPLSTDNQIEIFDENPNVKSVAAKAKRFRDVYQLKSSRIACQLLIKQDTTWHMTNIACETNIMEEREKQQTPKKSSKRSAPSYSSDDEDEYQVHHRSFAKKRKRSPRLQKGLPVTRVNKS